MFVIPTHVGFTHRVVAMLVACAVILGSIGVYTTAQAANLTNISNTLTDSGPSALSGHDISFTIATGTTLASGDNISITFPAGFTGVGTLTDVDLTVTVNGGAPETITNFSAAGDPTITFDGVAAVGDDVIRIVIADNVVTNPGTGSYEFYVELATTPTDSGRTRVAIVDYVTVSAVIDTTFNFVVAGTATSTTVNATTTTGATDATTIPFGTLSAGTVYTLAQELPVTTNAANGFVVTVEQDGTLESSTGADIDGFVNGSYVNTPTAWSAPTNSLLQENTWGHWGLTSDDSDLNGSEFTSGGGDKCVAASTTPREVFSHTDPADGTTQDYGSATVGYRVQISPLQEAGDDYTATLMYIATPTF